jgi:hypothetical protein
MNTSPAPLKLPSNAPTLDGNSVELVDPVTYARFRSSPTATANPPQQDQVQADQHDEAGQQQRELVNLDRSVDLDRREGQQEKR